MEKLNVAIADDNDKMVEILGRMIEEDNDLPFDSQTALYS